MTHASTLILHCSRVSNCWERNALLLESWRNKSLVFLCTLSVFCYFIFSCFLLFFIITTMSCKYYFMLMQYLLICYMIHRSSYLKFGGPDPAWPRAPKSGGSADPADPVLPTPLHMVLQWYICYAADVDRRQVTLVWGRAVHDMTQLWNWHILIVWK